MISKVVIPIPKPQKQSKGPEMAGIRELISNVPGISGDDAPSKSLDDGLT
jgi:hypothetical protein